MAKNDFVEEEIKGDKIEAFEEGERFTKNGEGRDDIRNGATYNTLAQFLKGIKEFGFSNGFVIKNRPGKKIDELRKLATGLINIKNMFEMFYQKVSTEGLNGITIGRQGDGKFRNTHLIQIDADHRTEIGDAEGITNGAIRMRVSRNGQDLEDRSGVYVIDRNLIRPGAEEEGTHIAMVAWGDASAQITYAATRESVRNSNGALSGGVRDIYVGPTGIFMYGLPTTNPAIAGALWNDSGTLKVSSG